MSRAALLAVREWIVESWSGPEDPAVLSLIDEALSAPEASRATVANIMACARAFAKASIYAWSDQAVMNDYTKREQAMTDLESMVTIIIARAERAGDGRFQTGVDVWMRECFGDEIARDKMERNHRFLEEALELVQANGCTQSEAHQLVDYVYGRDQGEINQEVGGVMVTLAALCSASGVSMERAGETELARVWTKIEKIRAKQAAKPKCSPLPEQSALARVTGELAEAKTDIEQLFEERDNLILDARDRGTAAARMREAHDRRSANMKRLEREHGLLVLKVHGASERIVRDCTVVADALLADKRIAYMNFAPCLDDSGKWDGDVLFSLFGTEKRSIDLWLSSDPDEPPVTFVRDSGERPLALTEHHDPVEAIASHLDWLFVAALAAPRRETGA